MGQLHWVKRNMPFNDNIMQTLKVELSDHERDEIEQRHNEFMSKKRVQPVRKRPRTIEQENRMELNRQFKLTGGEGILPLSEPLPNYSGPTNRREYLRKLLSEPSPVIDSLPDNGIIEVKQFVQESLLYKQYQVWLKQQLPGGLYEKFSFTEWENHFRRLKESQRIAKLEKAKKVKIKKVKTEDNVDVVRSKEIIEID